MNHDLFFLLSIDTLVVSSSFYYENIAMNILVNVIWYTSVSIFFRCVFHIIRELLYAHVIVARQLSLGRSLPAH